MRVEDSGLQTGPTRYITGNFITSRSDMEIVNGMAGVLAGILLLFPTFSLSTSPAFAGLLQITSNEHVWAAMFFAWGVGTFAAWACAGLSCRRWMMLVSTVVWGFLFWSTIFVASAPTLITALMAATGAGSVLAFKRMQRAE